MDIYFHLKIPLRYHPRRKGRVKGVKKGKGQRYKKYLFEILFHRLEITFNPPVFVLRLNSRNICMNKR